jgi:hypothetical protein
LLVQRRGVFGKTALAMTLQTTLLFVFGLIALTARVFLAVRFPNPTPHQQTVFRTVLALAGAGIAAVQRF